MHVAFCTFFRDVSALAREEHSKTGRRGDLLTNEMRLPAAVGFALVLNGPLAGQVNTEGLRRADLEPGVSGQAGVDFILRAGNVQLFLLAPSGRLDMAGERWTSFFVAQADFGWAGGERFSNQALMHLRYGYQVAERLTLEAFTQTDYDRSRRLSLRALAGGGPRLPLARSEGWELLLGTSYMFEHERLDLPPEALHPVETNAHRWSNYVTVRGGSGQRLGVVATAYAQPRFDDFGDTRVLGDARLAVQIIGALSLQVSGVVRWDGRPPDGTEKLDLSLRSGVRVDW